MTEHKDATALRFEGVHKQFGRQVVLRDLDLQIAVGEHVALTGANGAGKTTLLRLAATLSRPTKGTIQIAGHAPGETARRHLVYVAQEAPAYPELTPVEQLCWWSRLHGHALTPGDATAVLTEAGLNARAIGRPARVLSRGQRQRLVLACAFAAQAELLLLDEPTTALDGDGVAWFRRRLQAQSGAVLAAVHDKPSGTETHLRLEGGRLA